MRLTLDDVVPPRRYNYFVYNFQYTEVLVPKNEKLVNGVRSYTYVNPL